MGSPNNSWIAFAIGTISLLVESAVIVMPRYSIIFTPVIDIITEIYIDHY
jgi:hypothetical protein